MAFEGAPAELQHFSHVHALQLSAVQRPGEAVCGACNLPCPAGETAYRCAPCNYSLDRTCAHTPPAISHPGHPAHTLVLRAAPPSFADSPAACGACRGRVTAFSFRCAACDFALHISCANAPLHLRHRAHPHPLSLAFASPYGGTAPYACDVCRQVGAAEGWLYRCAPCGFDAHIGCATSPAQQSPPPQQSPRSRSPAERPASEGQPGAVDDALAVQMLAFSMQQAQIINATTNSIFQSHLQRISRPLSSPWQVDGGFMTAPTVPRPGFDVSPLLHGLTSSYLDAGIAGAAGAAAAASPAVLPGAGGFDGWPSSAANLADLTGGGSSAMAIPVPSIPRIGDPEEFLNNLIGNADWIPKVNSGFDFPTSFNLSGGGPSAMAIPQSNTQIGNPEEFLNNLIQNADWIPKVNSWSGFSTLFNGFDSGV